MTDAQQQNALTAVTALSLQQLTNIELATFNLAVQGFGKVDEQNLSFKKALELNLIDDTGKPFDLESCIDAATYEVNRRVIEGIWN